MEEIICTAKGNWLRPAWHWNRDVNQSNQLKPVTVSHLTSWAPPVKYCKFDIILYRSIQLWEWYGWTINRWADSEWGSLKKLSLQILLIQNDRIIFAKYMYTSKFQKFKVSELCSHDLSHWLFPGNVSIYET